MAAALPLLPARLRRARSALSSTSGLGSVVLGGPALAMSTEAQSQRRICADLVDYGFFGPPEKLQNETRTAQGFLFVPVAGVDRLLQFFRVCVGDGEREFVVVDSRDGADRGVARTAAAQRFGSAGCVLLLHDGEGHATVQHELNTERLEVAAAIAVIRYSAAWDESEVIVISDSDSQYAVSITVEDRRLWALVKTEAT